MRYWYLPISVKYFDFVRCLHDYDTFDVRMYANHKFNVGDAVIVYSGKPYGQFLYQMGKDRYSLCCGRIAQRIPS